MSTLRMVNPNSHEDWSKNENKRENNSRGCELTGKPATCTHKMLAFQKDGCCTVTVTHEGNTALSGVAGRIPIPVNDQQVQLALKQPELSLECWQADLKQPGPQGSKRLRCPQHWV